MDVNTSSSHWVSQWWDSDPRSRLYESRAFPLSYTGLTCILQKILDFGKWKSFLLMTVFCVFQFPASSAYEVAQTLGGAFPDLHQSCPQHPPNLF